MTKNILLLDGGGRGSAFYRALDKSELVKCVAVSPGNGGIPINDVWEPAESGFPGIKSLAELHYAHLVVPTSEAPLVAGIVDYLQAEGIPAFGPTAGAAELEGSKAFAKMIFDMAGVPTAEWVVANDFEDACKIIRSWGPCVIKADGLCGGKGVVVAETTEEAIEAARQMLVEKIHGHAGSLIVIERKLKGVECSVMAFCDGKNVRFFPRARDYKRAYDGDRGPNTGGMGSVSPAPDVSDELLQWMETNVFLPILREMNQRETPYHGILYVGFMLTKDGPMVLECNCRPGDPEIQGILELIESDIVPYLFACLEFGGLANLPPLKISPRKAVCIVLASEGYPGKCETGFPITDFGEDRPHAFILHAGTKRNESGQIVTSGGRVMNAIGIGDTFSEARSNARVRAGEIHFVGKWHRTDIALGLS